MWGEFPSQRGEFALCEGCKCLESSAIETREKGNYKTERQASVLLQSQAAFVARGI